MSGGAAADPPVVLVLVGLPGAGKSTLVAALQRESPGKWVRVCQDVLKTRPKCEKAAREALKQGLSPIIDRTNIDPKQREHWVKIAAEAGVPAHAVFLLVAPPLCMERIKARTVHETNPRPFVVNMMKGRLREPLAAEGFAQIDTVSTPEDVAAFVSRSRTPAVLGWTGGSAGTGVSAATAAAPKKRSKNAAAATGPKKKRSKNDPAAAPAPASS